LQGEFWTVRPMGHSEEGAGEKNYGGEVSDKLEDGGSPMEEFTVGWMKKKNGCHLKPANEFRPHIPGKKKNGGYLKNSGTLKSQKMRYGGCGQTSKEVGS